MKKLFHVMAAVAVLSGGRAAAQDAALGETTFKVCRSCHQIGETAKNFVGPVLNGVVDRKAGIYPGYPYSEANKTSGITWDVATLKVYLMNPRGRVPGTKMTFPGFQNQADADNVIAYLGTIGADGKRKD